MNESKILEAIKKNIAEMGEESLDGYEDYMNHRGMKEYYKLGKKKQYKEYYAEYCNGYELAQVRCRLEHYIFRS